jgi:molybdopterin synthase sulfur carrier subunit
MDVRFYATLRPIVGGKTIQVDLPTGATVCDLLHAATGRFPELGPLVWKEPGVLGDYIKVFVDGREIRHLQLLETPVAADAEVDIFPPVAGG